jgi:hypothetical protein
LLACGSILNSVDVDSIAVKLWTDHLMHSKVRSTDLVNRW